MINRTIKDDRCIAEGADYLRQLDDRFDQALVLTGPLPLRLKPDGFSALLDAIVGQQVSVASARAIWARLEAADLTSQGNILNASEEDLRACGLSRPKIRYAKALATSDIDYIEIRGLTDAELVSALVEIPGIGPWTAEVYAMLSLGRADVFAAGDLALQEAARVLFELESRPTEKELRLMAEAWSPWRGVAARLLWAYYRVLKEREGIR